MNKQDKDTLRAALEGELGWLSERHRNHQTDDYIKADIAVRIGRLRAAIALLDKEAEQEGEPVAWYIERVVPGKRDNGVKMGPFFDKEEADELADECHLIRPLYAHPKEVSVEKIMEVVNEWVIRHYDTDASANSLTWPDLRTSLQALSQ